MFSNNFLKNKKFLITFFSVFLIAVVFLMPNIAHAALLDSLILKLVSIVCNVIIYFVGQLLLIAISILIKVASFNDFIGANIVNIGWVIIRDIANMVIVIALLIIAFNTVLNRSSYGYQQMLPKLVIAAILVNFSKTITGLFIDLSQVLMMTFVHAFEGIAAGNLTYGFGIQDMLSINKAVEGGTGQDVTDWTVSGALILATLMVVIALGVVISMAVMLLLRIIRIWLLVIFSPIAFVGGLIPELKQYADQWRNDLTKQLTFGPTLAFLFWLSMTVISQLTQNSRMMDLELQTQQTFTNNVAGASPVNYAYFASQVSSPQRIFDFMVTCALLIMTLAFAQKAGVAGSEIAGNFMGKLNAGANWLKKRPGAIMGGVGRSVAGSRGAQYLAGMGSTFKDRLKTSKVSHGIGTATGGLINFDKEYAQQKAAEFRARGSRRAGDSNALRQLQYQNASKRQKEMEEKGELSGGDDALRDMLHKKIKDGDMDDARAIMSKMASSKESNLRTEDLQAYEKGMNIEKNSGSKDEQDYMRLMEDLKASQKASGDTMADYKFGVERDSSGVLKYTSSLAEKVKEDFAKKKTADFNDKGLLKAMDESKPEFRAILDELANKTDMNALGVDGRDAYAKILQRTLARDGHDINLTTEQKTKYTDLLERTKAKVFRRGTGEAMTIQSDGFDDLRPEDQRAVREATKEFGDAIKPDELNKVRQEFEQKKIEKAKENKYYNREQLSETDKEIDEKVLRPIIEGKNSKAQVYNLSDEVRKKGSKSNILNMASQLRNEAVNRASSYTSDVVDPNTGQKYSGDQAFNNSSFGKNIDRVVDLARQGTQRQLSDEEEKELKNLSDSLVFDMQRSKPGGIGKGKLKEWTGRKKERQIANRIVNRDSLSSVVGAVESLQSTAMIGGQRNKIVNSIIKNVNKAVKDTGKYNQEDEGLNRELGDLKKLSEKIKSGNPTDLKAFQDKANRILDQFKAK